MSPFKRISVDEADQILLNNPNALLLDIRDKQCFADSHHPRAYLLDDTLLKKILKQADKKAPVIAYCYHGNSSQDIARMLADFGFKDCYSVDGGYAAWKHQIASDFELSSQLKRWMDDKGYKVDDVNARLDNDNKTALMLAAKQGNAEIVRELTEAGANPNLTDANGNNALWYACLGQSIDCVQHLLKADVEVDNQNTYGFTALNYAVGIDDIFNLLANYFHDDSLLRLHKPVSSEPQSTQLLSA